MSVPPTPSPFEQLGQLPFSLYPPIAGVEPNDWRYSGCTWGEVLVTNTATREQIAIPRRWLGTISAQDDGGLVIQLLKRVELRNGIVRPAHRRVIVMPAPAEMMPREPSASACGSVTPIRLDGSGNSKLARIAVAALALGIAASVLAAYLDRGEIIDSRATVQAKPSRHARPIEARQF